MEDLKSKGIARLQKVKCEVKKGVVEILSFSLELDLPLSD
jgi:hypothetical protein